MIDNPDRVQVLYLPFPHDDLQTEGLVVSPREIDLKPKVGIVLPYGMYGTTAKVLRTDANGNLGISVQGAAGALPATFQDLLGHTLGPLVSEAGGGYAAPFSMLLAQSLNLVAPRTDTVTVSLANIVIPPAYEYVFMLRTTAASGASPTLTVSFRATDTQGTQFSIAALTQVTSATTVNLAVGPGLNNEIMVSPITILVTIGGTTPSFTWYLDVFYR